MTDINSNFAGLINRTGLYRVWVRLRHDGNGPLISVWIDPAMAASESDARENPAPVSNIAENESAELSDECALSVYGAGAHALG